VRGAITNDFIAVTLDGGLRVPFRGSRAGEIRGMTGRIPLFAWEEAFPLEKIRNTRRSGTYLARTHRPEAVHLTFQFLIARTIHCASICTQERLAIWDWKANQIWIEN